MAPRLTERQLLTLAAGVAASAALGYVFLGSYLPSFGWSKKMDKDTVPGLYNRYGNDCFANCVIQSLAGIPSFREYLHGRVERDIERELKLSKALSELLDVLNLPAKRGKSTAVEPVIMVLEEMYKSRISRSQQDSQEFLHFIHEALSREDTRLKNRHPNPESLRIPSNPFEGELSTQITCQRCSFTTPWKKEAFIELIVAVPSKSTCTLPECLSSLITVESLPDYACPSCTLQNTFVALERTPKKPPAVLSAMSRLRTFINQIRSSPIAIDIDLDHLQLPAQVDWKHTKTPAIKRTVVSSAPKVLVVHLRRSVYERGFGAERNSCGVSFEEELTVPLGGGAVEKMEAIDEEGTQYAERYRLMSVVTHKGWHDSGHYICYRRRKRQRKHVRRNVPQTAEKSSIEVEEQEKAVGGVEVDGAIAGLGLEEDAAGLEWLDSRTKWWEISDEVVTGVHRDDVLLKRKGVYLLFYERAV